MSLEAFNVIRDEIVEVLKNEAMEREYDKFVEFLFKDFQERSKIYGSALSCGELEEHLRTMKRSKSFDLKNFLKTKLKEFKRKKKKGVGVFE